MSELRTDGRSPRRRPPDGDPPPERTAYRVTYTLAGSAVIRRTEVSLLPGYSQESDIPRLVAARLTGRADDGVRITLLGLRAL
ncbi:hypothetical protein [Kitasatospora sp. NBC_00315]|uniref:hypothetical protein n=1 Tax=Kitasatospora sp. NBC_00315 TaxID=2975963 RepID=UPI0032536AAC